MGPGGQFDADFCLFSMIFNDQPMQPVTRPLSQGKENQKK